MALAGIKKQFNKTGQYLSEKIGVVEGTKPDDEFRELERKSDLTSRAVEQLVERVKEYLQPNPATRAKMSALATLASLRGDSKQRPYPQVEGLLGEAMDKIGHELVNSSSSSKSIFGDSLIETGESFKQLAEVKYALEAEVGQAFFEPLNQLTNRELKDMHAQRKKLESRRLDYDGKKRKQEKGTVVPPDELRVAEEKFEESRVGAENSMRHLLDNEVEQVTQLCELSTAMASYYKQALTIVEGLNTSLQVRRAQAVAKARLPSVVAKPRQLSTTSSSYSSHAQTLPSKSHTTATTPSANAYGDDVWNTPAPPESSSTLSYNNNAASNHNNNNSRASNYSSASMASQDPFSQPPERNNTQPEFGNNSTVNTGMQKPSPNPRPFNLGGGGNMPVRLPPPPASPRVQQNGFASNVSPPPYAAAATNRNASCKALYDFVPEKPQELAFKEGDVLQLLQRVDENWYEGRLNGRQGYFPVSYVQVLVPLQ